MDGGLAAAVSRSGPVGRKGGRTGLPKDVARPAISTARRRKRWIEEVRIVQQPLYVPAMPRTGKEMSVRMTQCGALGWVTDQEHRLPLPGRPVR